MKKTTKLLVIDPQNDFCDPKGALYVPGADKDMERLAAFIRSNIYNIDRIDCTLDSHPVMHIAHPYFWVNSKGENPKPFTLITDDDVRNGIWRTYHPYFQSRGQYYVDTLKKNGRYVLCIWPPHCLIGSWGHSLYPAISDALIEWQKKNTFWVNFVTKGSNFLTEHYSALSADCPDDNDVTTKLNTDFIDSMTEADDIYIAGEALSHCVNWTVTDLADNFGDHNIQKFILLEDATSNVTGFEKLGQDFIKSMVKRGMRISKTTIK